MRPPPPAAQRLALGALLAALVTGIYAQVRTHEFVAYDDPIYVTENPEVRAGWTRDGAMHALLGFHPSNNWHPLTTWSHMLDVDLWDLDAGAPLLENAALHLANALLVFALFLRWTRRTARSFLVAALFASHPIHVESVAWVSERKDVLSGLLALLCLHAWTSWTRRGGALRYALAWGCLALGLSAKPMLVTLPCLLLLLDLWPLDRGGLPLRTRLVEKLPFLPLVLLSATLTSLAQGGAMADLAFAPLPARIANAVWAWPHYVARMLWPVGLAPFYPWRDLRSEPGALAASGAALLAITAGAFRARRRAPWAWVGWLWFAGMLVPVIGLLQVGAQSTADRYTYLPGLGLYAALVWGSAEGLARLHAPAAARAAIAAVVLAALAALAHAQAGVWRDTRTLAMHGIEVAPDVFFWHGLLATDLVGEARRSDDPARADELLAEAEAALRENLRLEPRDALALRRLGDVLILRGRPDEARTALRESLRLRPGDARTRFQLGRASEALGRIDRAEAWVRRALEVEPGNPDLVVELGRLLERQDRLDEAEAQYRRALAILPITRAAWRLGALLRRESRFDEAIPLLEGALAHGLEPADARACAAELERARHRSSAPLDDVAGGVRGAAPSPRGSGRTSSGSGRSRGARGSGRGPRAPRR